MISGLATSLMKFPRGGASWTLEPHNSMKTREPWKFPLSFVDYFAFYYQVLILLSFPDLQETDKYRNLRLKVKLGKDMWLLNSWSNFINGGASTSQARTQHFIEVWPELAPPNKATKKRNKLSPCPLIVDNIGYNIVKMTSKIKTYN